jgi:hypothetical protein
MAPCMAPRILRFRYAVRPELAFRALTWFEVKGASSVHVHELLFTPPVLPRRTCSYLWQKQDPLHKNSGIHVMIVGSRSR